jgi:hypothetical protein
MTARLPWIPERPKRHWPVVVGFVALLAVSVLVCWAPASQGLDLYRERLAVEQVVRERAQLVPLQELLALPQPVLVEDARWLAPKQPLLVGQVQDVPGRLAALLKDTGYVTESIQPIVQTSDSGQRRVTVAWQIEGPYVALPQVWRGLWSWPVAVRVQRLTVTPATDAQHVHVHWALEMDVE